MVTGFGSSPGRAEGVLSVAVVAQDAQAGAGNRVELLPVQGVLAIAEEGEMPVGEPAEQRARLAGLMLDR